MKPSLLKYWGWSSPLILDVPYSLASGLYLLDLKPKISLWCIWDPISELECLCVSIYLTTAFKVSATVQLFNAIINTSDLSLICMPVWNLILLGANMLIRASSILWNEPLNNFHTPMCSEGHSVPPVGLTKSASLSDNEYSNLDENISP